LRKDSRKLLNRMGGKGRTTTYKVYKVAENQPSTLVSGAMGAKLRETRWGRGIVGRKESAILRRGGKESDVTGTGG